MIQYEQLYNEVKKRLSEERFIHSEGVVKRAIEYAQIYKVDIETIKLVAIAHDIAKEQTDEENKKYIQQYNIVLDDIEKINKNLVHAKIGAYICQNEFNFTEDMTNAVKYHTTGRANMSILEKIIYIADATEENRKYNYNEYVEITKKDINKAIAEMSKWVIKKLSDSNIIIHPNTIECYNYYKEEK